MLSVQPMTKLGRPAAPELAQIAWQRYRPVPGTKGRAKLAKALGIQQANINMWRAVPEKHLNAVASFLDVEPKILRPDLFDPFESLKGTK